VRATLSAYRARDLAFSASRCSSVMDGMRLGTLPGMTIDPEKPFMIAP
jgi:hypothetical protein